MNPIPHASRPGVVTIGNMVKRIRNAMPQLLRACIGVVQELPLGFFFVVGYETCLLQWNARLDSSRAINPMQLPTTTMGSNKLFQNLGPMHGRDGENVIVHKSQKSRPG